MKQETSRVFHKLCEDCRQAFYNESPVIYILTDELYLIHKLLCANVMTPWYCRVDNEVMYFRDYEREMKQIYMSVKDIWHQQTISFGEISGKTDIPLEKLEKYLTDYKAEDGKLRQTDFVEKYERGEILKGETNCNFYDKESFQRFCKRIEKIESEFTCHIQVLWNFIYDDAFYRSLCEYVKAYEQSPANSPYRNSTLLLCASEYKLPESLQNYVSVIEVPLPDEGEIQGILEEEIKSCGAEPIYSRAYLNAMTIAFKGYNSTNIRKLFKNIVSKAENDINRYDALRDIQNDKKRLINKYKILTLTEPEEDGIRVGGQENLLGWLRKQKSCLKNSKEESDIWGISAAKGALVCGIPGTGKSLAAKQIALPSEMNLPLLKMDIGELMNKYLGESEQNMRHALRLAEAMAPCILWIDELEKGFSGAGRGRENSASGTFGRIFGTFLTWMQDKKSSVFIYATCNDVSRLPGELLRNGRFDAMFGTFMPTENECVDIYRKTLAGMKARVDSAIREGVKVEPLFALDALNEQALRTYVELGIKEGRRKFMTGADIYTIANVAVRLLKEEEPKRKKPVCVGQMIWAIDQALNEVRTYGEGKSNLKHIARTYRKLLKDKFLPASDKLLITLEEFEHKTEVLEEKPDEKMSDYDFLLRRAVLLGDRQ